MRLDPSVRTRGDLTGPFRPTEIAFQVARNGSRARGLAVHLGNVGLPYFGGRIPVRHVPAGINLWRIVRNTRGQLVGRAAARWSTAMPELIDGFELREFGEAIRVLASARGLDDLRDLMETRPIYSSPYFHAQFRQTRIHYESDSQQHPEAFAAFLEVYDALFTLLAYRAYASQPAVKEGPEASAGPVAPALLLELKRTAGDSLPAADGPTLIAQRDGSAIAQELEQMLGRRFSLREYAPLAGGVFALLRVQCLECGTHRLALRAYAIDLRTDSQWLSHLQAGRVNADACPNCRTTNAHVIRYWVTEVPAPADPLAALSCLYRSDNEAIYMPPPGTVRRPEHDRILEVRLEMLARQLGPPWARTRDQGVHIQGVAYTVAELARRVAETEKAGRGNTEYEDICQRMTERLKSGDTPFRDAEKFLRGIAGPWLAEWPLVDAVGGDPYEVLVRRLVFEACAEARSLSPALRAAAACCVSQSYAALGQVGLAEMSLARAEDLMRGLDAAEARSVRTSLLAAQETLHIARGESAEAERVRARLVELLAADAVGPEERLVRAEMAMNQAIDAKSAGRLSEAVRLMQQGLATFTALEQELAEQDPPEAARARVGRSGTLANLSSARVEIADALKVFGAIAACEGHFDRLSEDVRAELARIGSAEKLMELQHELNEELPKVLGEDLDEHDLRLAGLRELREAIALAESTSHVEYLGIQWFQLSRLLRQFGQQKDAREALANAQNYTARAGDQRHLAAVSWAQAMDAAADGNLAAKLNALRRCLRAEMRSIVQGQGEVSSLAHTGGFALDSTSEGEPAMQAIALAEGTKRLALARSLAHGSPLTRSDQSQGLTARLDDLIAERETLRVQAMWQGQSDRASPERTEALDAAIEAGRIELAQRDPLYAAWHDATYLEAPDGASLRRVLARLGSRATLLGFLIQGSVAYAYVLWDEGAMVRSRPIGAELTESLRRADKDSSPSQLTALLAALLEDLEERLGILQSDDALIVSPCEELAQVAFAALPTGRKLLCQRATLSTVYGAGMLEACTQRPALEWRTAVCVGAPSRPDAPSLVYARAELVHVSELLSAAGIRVGPPCLGAEATVAGLRRLAVDSDIIHLSCHAQPPLPESPSGRLLLSPDLLAGDSGVLTEDRIIGELALKQGALVVLAACSGGVFGTARRFLDHGQVPAWLIVGARQVLGSLAPIGDAAALQFHSAFYRHLVAGYRPAAALAMAQREAARGELGPSLQAPDNWAAYVLYGAG
jgi:CHAT domain-containing protein